MALLRVCGRVTLIPPEKRIAASKGCGMGACASRDARFEGGLVRSARSALGRVRGSHHVVFGCSVGLRPRGSRILARHASTASFGASPTCPPGPVFGRGPRVNRSRAMTLAFAGLVAAVVVGMAVFAYMNVRGAFEREFTARVHQLAELAASQVAVADLHDARDLGPDGNGLLALQLDALASASGLSDVTVLDDSSRVIYEVRAGFARHDAVSRYDSLSHATLVRARREGHAAFPPFRLERAERRAVAVAIPSAEGALLVAEDAPRWGIELEHLRRDLVLLAAVSLLAVLALAFVVLRANASQWALERRLSRSENLAAMGRMTATLAHEIKNPLAIIRGSARRLGKLAPDAQAMADSVVEEVDRLSSTVNRYLEFARGGTPDGPSRGDAATTLAATVTLLQGEFGARGCTLALESPASAGVSLDDASLKQIWLNLIQNALEAVADGGTVEARCLIEADRVRVRIVDDGPGIPAEVLARLDHDLQFHEGYAAKIITTSDFQTGKYDITWVENFLRQEGMKG